MEVLPFARRFVERQVTELGAAATLRLDAGGTAWRSDQGNIVLDCAFGPIADPVRLADALSAVPGLLGHGLFVREIDALYLGTAEGVIRRDRRITLA